MKQLLYRIVLFAIVLLPSLATHADDEARKAELTKLFHAQYARMALDSALATVNEIIELAQKTGDENTEGRMRWNRVAMLNNGGRYEELIGEATVQRQWFGAHGNWERYYQCWQRICSASHDQGHMQTAMREAKLMSDDAKQRNNNTGRAMAYKQMAIIYLDLGQYSQAIEGYDNALELLKGSDDFLGIRSGVYEGLCLALYKQKDYNRQLRACDEWQRHLEALVAKQGIETMSQTYVDCYCYYARAYIGMQRYEDAEQAIEKAEEYQRVDNVAPARRDIYEVRAELSLAQQHYEQALAFTDSARKPDGTWGNAVMRYRAEALLKTGKGFESAQLYKKLFNDKDSIFSRDMRIQLDEFSTLMHVDDLERGKRDTQMRYAMVIVVLVVLSLLIFGIITRRSARRLATKNRELGEKNAALELATVKAEESSKIKTEFIRNISHEIRTPLNILNGFTQVMLSDDAAGLSSTERADIAARVSENTDRITGLVNKILTLAESNSHRVIERNDLETVGNIVDHAISSVMEPAGEIMLQVNIPDDMKALQLKTNADLAALALAQLIDNAFKFTKKGTVSVIVRDEQEKIVFIVEDTGIGIAAEHAQRIFDEFVQIDDYYDGTGIGLTMARSIARRMDGDIVLDTTYTSGARFLFSLPK